MKADIATFHKQHSVNNIFWFIHKVGLIYISLMTRSVCTSRINSCTSWTWFSLLLQWYSIKCYYKFIFYQWRYFFYRYYNGLGIYKRDASLNNSGVVSFRFLLKYIKIMIQYIFIIFKDFIQVNTLIINSQPFFKMDK